MIGRLIPLMILTGVFLILLSAILLAAPSPGASDPTPLQRKKEAEKAIEEKLVAKRMALAYGCGWSESRGGLMEGCREYRTIAFENGFKP